MKEFQGCETVTSDPDIVVSDPGSKNKRSKFRLRNSKRNSIKVIQVDSCAIKNGIRCDYLLILPNKKELYVELKGSDVKHAVKQIARSIDLLSCNCQSVVKLCFIASTRCPINSTDIQILKKKFRKEYNAKLIIKNGEIIYNFDSE